jgi:hypothetical protein
MKILATILLLFAANSAFAQSWGPEDIKFKLEDRSSFEAMIWLSGFSYAVSDVSRALGCKDTVGQLFLIESLNSEYAGKIVTAEQATEHLGNSLSNLKSCNPYNKRMQSDWPTASR